MPPRSMQCEAVGIATGARCKKDAFVEIELSVPVMNHHSIWCCDLHAKAIHNNGRIRVVSDTGVPVYAERKADADDVA
jgi:hypothetical protein